MTLLPCVDTLWIFSQKIDESSSPHSYHPSHPRLASAVHALSLTALALTELHLGKLQFSSATDVVRLCSMFPRLLLADIYECTIPESGSRAIAPPPSTRMKQLQYYLPQSKTRSSAADTVSLAHWWAWPHPDDDSDVGPYPGLHKANIPAVFTLLRYLHPRAKDDWK